MTDTIKQLYNLLWFCKKVNIPFEVYAFTNCYPLSDDGSIRKPSYDKKAGVAFVEETFFVLLVHFLMIITVHLIFLLE